jgi:predicted CopG family antitoxin
MPRVSMFKLNGLAWALTKRVTIRDGACKKLLAVKGGGESFSELFERLLEGASPLGNLDEAQGMRRVQG